MNTYFTIWHWSILVAFVILFIGLVFLAFQEKNHKNTISMIFASFLVIVTAGVFSIMAIDKYTKKAELYGVKNTRVLYNESIVYTGYVKNSGDYTIGTVTFKLKLINKGHVVGNVKGGNFYSPSGLIHFLTSFGEESTEYRPQKIEKEFVVAEDLEPGKSAYFRVQMEYPAYFKHVAHFTSIKAH